MSCCPVYCSTHQNFVGWGWPLQIGGHFHPPHSKGKPSQTSIVWRYFMLGFAWTDICIKYWKAFLRSVFSNKVAFSLHHIGWIDFICISMSYRHCFWKVSMSYSSNRTMSMRFIKRKIMLNTTSLFSLWHFCLGIINEQIFKVLNHNFFICNIYGSDQFDLTR